MKVAIMVDGGFYLRQASKLFGAKSPEDRATELYTYALRHIDSKHGQELYRIFYYDCPPSEKTVYHPLKRKNIPLNKSPLYMWTKIFHKELTCKRKMALRMGELLEGTMGYNLSQEAVKRLCSGSISVSDLTESDFYLDIKQKGVDMRIGLDIASLANKRLVDQIVLIAGDSDFVPAAKHARREGIDFILDPMWHTIKPSLNEHIDGLISRVGRPPSHYSDPLCTLANPELAKEQGPL